MKELKKYEVWEDYWCYEPIKEVPFLLLRTLNYYCWKPRENDKINIRLESFNNSEVPSENQIKALDFVIENESKILDGIWEYYNNLILPVYLASTNIEKEYIAMHKSELNKVFGVTAIEVTPFDSISDTYFLIEFDFKYDCEHGLYLLFQNDEPIDLFSEGDKDYDSINLYENGLYNEDESPLRIHISDPNGKPILEGEYFYDQKIDFRLAKGAYRIFYTVNKSRRCRNFFTNENLETFSLEYVLSNCKKLNTT